MDSYEDNHEWSSDTGKISSVWIPTINKNGKTGIEAKQGVELRYPPRHLVMPGLSVQIDGRWPFGRKWLWSSAAVTVTGSRASPLRDGVADLRSRGNVLLGAILSPRGQLLPYHIITASMWTSILILIQKTVYFLHLKYFPSTGASSTYFNPPLNSSLHLFLFSKWSCLLFYVNNQRSCSVLQL